jgi:hypothetical protein
MLAGLRHDIAESVMKLAYTAVIVYPCWRHFQPPNSYYKGQTL